MEMCTNNNDFTKTRLGEIVLKKIPNCDPNFRLCFAGWLIGEYAMVVIGAIFRKAKFGPNEGNMTVPIPGTKITIYLTPDEVKQAGFKYPLPEWKDALF